MLPFGSVVTIPATDRKGVVSGQITVNNRTTTLIYPISSCIYLASSQDFLCHTSTNLDTIMIETWNPILIVSKQDLQIVDTISKDTIEMYEKFIYSLILNVDFEEKRLFTGSPISANVDIRHFFHLQERKPFEFLLRPFKKLLVSLITPISM